MNDGGGLIEAKLSRVEISDTTIANDSGEIRSGFGQVVLQSGARINGGLLSGDSIEVAPGASGVALADLDVASGTEIFAESTLTLSGTIRNDGQITGSTTAEVGGSLSLEGNGSLELTTIAAPAGESGLLVNGDGHALTFAEPGAALGGDALGILNRGRIFVNDPLTIDPATGESFTNQGLVFTDSQRSVSQSCQLPC